MLGFLMICAGILSAVNAQAGPNGYPDQDRVCPPLRVGRGVAVIPPTCTSTKMRAGEMCSFSCKEGFRVRGPPMKMCMDSGSWSIPNVNISCTDIDECRFNNGGCSHKCINTVGNHRCECPSHLKLAEDGKRCKAEGLKLTCRSHDMSIVIPKNIIHNLHHQHLRLNDPKCRASHNKTHYILNTALTGCGTTSRQIKDYIVYSNKVSEEPDRSSTKIGRVLAGEVQVPFCCYFHNKEIVHAVGMRPYTKKVYIKVKGRGNIEVKLNFYKGMGYGGGPGRSSNGVYTWEDFPVSVHLRQRLFFEVSLVTKEKDLEIFADKCCSTPTRDHEKSRYLRHTFINNGCPVDRTVRFHRSPSPTKQRFSLEAFKFLGDHPFVFLHCHVRVCDANDQQSRCKARCVRKEKLDKKSPAKIQPKAHSKTKRAVSLKINEGLYVNQGPFLLGQRKQRKLSMDSPQKTHRNTKKSFDEAKKQDTRSNGYGLPRISHVVLGAMTVAAAMALVGVMYFGYKSRQLAPVGYDHVITKTDVNF